MRPTILTIEAFVALLSAWGLAQRRSKALRLAIVLGWLGALPGFLVAMVGLPTLGRGGPLMPAGELARGLGGLFLAYLVFALPLFGPLTFLAGLVGGALINRYSQPPAPRWTQPAAIVGLAALAAVPVVLLLPDFSAAAVVSSAFWAAALLLARRRLFVERPAAAGA